MRVLESKTDIKLLYYQSPVDYRALYPAMILNISLAHVQSVTKYTRVLSTIYQIKYIATS